MHKQQRTGVQHETDCHSKDHSLQKVNVMSRCRCPGGRACGQLPANLPAADVPAEVVAALTAGRSGHAGCITACTDGRPSPCCTLNSPGSAQHCHAGSLHQGTCPGYYLDDTYTSAWFCDAEHQCQRPVFVLLPVQVAGTAVGRGVQTVHQRCSCVSVAACAVLLETSQLVFMISTLWVLCAQDLALNKEGLPLLDEAMQQLALICSFASFRPVDADKLPENLATVWSTLSQHRQGVCDIARVIDAHLITKAGSGIPTASTAEKKPPFLQEAPSDSSSESDEEPPEQKALAIAPKPAKAHNKAAAPASKPTQPQAATAASSLASSLADAMRPTPAVVNDGDQRAATKRQQLRNKLKKAHEAAGNPDASQKAQPVVPTLAEVEAIREDPSLPQICSVSQSDAAGSELPAVKPSKRRRKRQRRRPAAAVAAETTACSAGLQLDAADGPSDGPSTAEGTSGSSAASLVGSEAGTPPATSRGQADLAVQGTAAGSSDVMAPTIVADDNASSKEGSMAAHDHAASTSHLPAADSSMSLASAPGDATVQADSMLKHADAATESMQPDSKAIARGAEPGPAQTSTKPDISKQTPDATTGSPVVASAHQAAAPEADKEPPAPPEQISNTSPPTRSLAPSPQASSAADTGRTTTADTATGSAAGRDAEVQPPKPASLAKQKVEQLPSAATVVAAAAPPPQPPAAIAAHRPAAKVVLRASAAPYTPLRSKATLVNSTKAPATGAKPGPTPSSSSAEDKGKKQIPAGTCLCSVTWNQCYASHKTCFTLTWSEWRT